MIERRCIQNRSHTAVLRVRRVVVRCAVDPRKARGAITTRPSCQWSESEAATGMAPADRALWRKDAHLRLYHFWKPGTPWMCPRARKGVSR
jgi:hypothetical protein